MVRPIYVVLMVVVLLHCPKPTEAGPWEASPWTVEVVDSFGGLSVNAGLSADTDSQGRLHVAYYSIKGADMMYALWSGGSWTVETVDEFQVVGTDCSITVDAQDTPHICYYDRTNEELEYARRNGTGWAIETVDWLAIVGRGTSIAIDGTGVPHLAYVGARTLRCANPTEDGWNITIVDEVESHVSFPSIAIGPDGAQHIVYLGTGRVKHATQSNGTWATEIVAGLHGQMVPMPTALATTPDGGLFCCYSDLQASRVVFARRTGEAWTTERVDEGFSLGDLDMVVGVDGEPRLAYLSLAVTEEGKVLNTDVWYANRSKGEWTVGPVMNCTESRGALIDVELDEDGHPVLMLVDISPTEVEANLIHARDWSGEHVEPFPRDPSRWPSVDVGDDDEASKDDSMLPMVLLVIVLAIAITVLLTIMGSRREMDDGAD